MTYAPIVVFAFNRPKHIRRVLRNLRENPECAESPVTIYCDGARNEKERKMVNKTRAAILKEAPSHAEIVFRGENFGLANSISYGVTKACEDHGAAIIIEDDLIISRGTLSYFNRALDFYKNEDKVMHIAAYMFPSDVELPDAFFYREATCWGWATWDRAWKHYNADAEELVKEIEKRELLHDYNINNSMFFIQMLRKQALGEIDSWAIRWYASMFLRGGLSLHPGKSLVFNDGFDGSGVHSSFTDRFNVERADQFTGQFPSKIEESSAAVLSMMDFRGNNFLPHKKNWPDLPEGTTPPIRKSTGKPMDLSIPPGETSA